MGFYKLSHVFQMGIQMFQKHILHMLISCVLSVRDVYPHRVLQNQMANFHQEEKIMCAVTTMFLK